MATELELKTVVADPATLRTRLREAGAVRGFRGFMRDRRFDRDGELDARDEVLRLRLWLPEGDGPHRAVVAFKGPTTVNAAGYKHRDELEYDAAPGEAVLATFQALGYVITHAIDRFVEVWRVGDTTVRLEWYPRMDVLAEIEGAPDGIEATIRTLGLERRACLPDALVSFTARYQQRTGRPALLAEAELEDMAPGWATA